MANRFFSTTMVPDVRRLLRRIDRSDRFAFWGLVSLRSLSAVLDMVGVLLVGLLTLVAASSFGAADGKGPTVIFGVEIPQFDDAGIVLLASAALAVFVTKAVVATLLTRALTRRVAVIEAKNAERIARYIFAGKLDRMNGITQADLQYAMTGAVTYGFTGALNNFSIVVSESFLLLVMTTTFFLVDPMAAVFTLLYFVVVVIVIQFFIGRFLKRAGLAVVDGTVDTIDLLNSTSNAFREITVLKKNDVFIDRVMEARRRVSSSDASMALLGVMPRYVIETALILGVVLLVGQQFLSGQLVTGLATVATFLAGGVRLMASLMPLQNSVGHVKQHLERARPALDLLDIVDVEEKDAEAGAGVASVPPSGDAAPLAVRFDDVSFRYPTGATDVLHKVDLSINAGDYVAIIGPSGAGKTTLVDALLGLVTPTQGSVTIDEVTPLAFRLSQPGVISYVPQKPGIVSGTIAENVALGVAPESIDRARVSEVLAAAYLQDFVDSLPQGMDTALEVDGTTLSGGQIQRIGLARALYTHPRLLVLDEATSGLDATSEAFVARTVADLHGSMTVVVIAHRLSTVQHADIVHFLDKGKVAASGDFKTIRDTVPAVAEYVRLMSFEG